MNNEKGFTLIEMMIVLLVISVLLIITVPNIVEHNSSINDKGCNAYMKMVEAQIQAYEMEEGVLPSDVSDLIGEGYLAEGQEKCPHGKTVKIGSKGEVTEHVE